MPNQIEQILDGSAVKNCCARLTAWNRRIPGSLTLVGTWLSQPRESHRQLLAGRVGDWRGNPRGKLLVCIQMEWTPVPS